MKCCAPASVVHGIVHQKKVPFYQLYVTVGATGARQGAEPVTGPDSVSGAFPHQLQSLWGFKVRSSLGLPVLPPNIWSLLCVR